MRKTHSKTGSVRSHHALKVPTFSKCSNCGSLGKPHIMCAECGFYNGREVVDMKAKKAKRDARLQAKKEQIRTPAMGREPESADDGKAVEEKEPEKIKETKDVTDSKKAQKKDKKPE